MTSLEFDGLRVRPAFAMVFVVALAACTTGASSPSPSEVRSPSPVASPADSGGVEDVARIRCEGDGATTLLTPVVRAQIDGIHVVTVNPTGEDRSIDVEDIGGDNAPMGTSETVWAIEPGAARVRCFDTDLDAGLDIGWVELTIVDPAGSFHPTALDCTDQTAMSIDYVPEAAGASDDPIALTLGLVADDDPTYEVEAAGYAQEDSRQVRVRDGGRAIALARWSSTGSGGWLLMSVTTCADVRIDWVP